HQLAVALDNSRHYQEAKMALEELARAQENLRTYLRLATEAQEEERKRLARELHDDTIQSLVVIKASLDALMAEKRLPAMVGARLDAVRRMVEAAVDDVRRFSRDLRPSMLDDLGLVHAVDWLVADMAQRTGIQARLKVEGEPWRLRAETEVAVYRIVQEALRNVEKHSGAASVDVMLSFSPDGLVAEVADDGRGFDPAQVLEGHGHGAGLGLMGMQERAQLVGATASIRSQPGQGACVTIEVQG
ncbi:MAG TPA: sensor histidine kinase, partial [Dehalococcoidia bacterium]|nr:sensor histidine kinase [Dehalococcoidia bacterium]